MAEQNPRRLRLSKTIMTTMQEQALASPRSEVCGLLGGGDDTARSYYPIDNIARQPAREYLMDPEQQIDAMRSMRERGESLLAIYHSHPDAPAEPSAADLAMAEYPDTIYVIAGPVGKAMQLNAYHYDGSGFLPAETIIIDNK